MRLVGNVLCVVGGDEGWRSSRSASCVWHTKDAAALDIACVSDRRDVICQFHATPETTSELGDCTACLYLDHHKVASRRAASCLNPRNMRSHAPFSLFDGRGSTIDGMPATWLRRSA